MGSRPYVSHVPSLPHYVSFQTIRTGSGILSFRPCWCPSPFPLLPYLGVIPSTLLHLPLDFICVSSLRLIYLPQSVDPSLTHFLGEFPGFGTGSGTRCCGPRGGAGVCMKQKFRFKFLPWMGFEPRTIIYNYCKLSVMACVLAICAPNCLQSDGRERLNHSTTMSSCLTTLFHNEDD